MISAEKLGCLTSWQVRQELFKHAYARPTSATPGPERTTRTQVYTKGPRDSVTQRTIHWMQQVFEKSRNEICLEGGPFAQRLGDSRH